jgi:hypothetical protein
MFIAEIKDLKDGSSFRTEKYHCNSDQNNLEYNYIFIGRRFFGTFKSWKYKNIISPFSGAFETKSLNIWLLD